MVQLATRIPPAEKCESEGGSLRSTSYEEALGLTPFLTETYVVGGYAYASLADAVAQGRRMQEAGMEK